VEGEETLKKSSSVCKDILNEIHSLCPLIPRRKRRFEGKNQDRAEISSGRGE